MKHANIALFVPHLGCRHQCSFCDQRSITGTAGVPSAAEIEKAVKTAAGSENYDPKSCQIAFFGGSFTAIDRKLMLELLQTAHRYVLDGTVSGIRVSTRPDAIDDAVLDVLKAHGVQAIELGAQSMCDDVLHKNKRGHTAQDVENACVKIKRYGFELGLQMMTGLYGDTDEKAVYTAREIVRLQADTVRIYPTVVLKNTPLFALYQRGAYRPQTVEEAIELGAKLLQMFLKAGVKVIRFGLHTVEPDSFVAGAFHPCLAERAYSRLYRRVINAAATNLPHGAYRLLVCPADLSRAIGYKRENIAFFKEQGLDFAVCPDAGIKPYDVKILGKG